MRICFFYCYFLTLVPDSGLSTLELIHANFTIKGSAVAQEHTVHTRSATTASLSIITVVVRNTLLVVPGTYDMYGTVRSDLGRALSASSRVEALRVSHEAESMFYYLPYN